MPRTEAGLRLLAEAHDAAWNTPGPWWHMSENRMGSYIAAIEAEAVAAATDLAGALLAHLPDSLDAAWAEAEDALPEGWHLILSTSSDAGNDAYARKPGSVLPWEFAGNGPTHAAALRDLAAKLRAR